MHRKFAEHVVWAPFFDEKASKWYFKHGKRVCFIWSFSWPPSLNIQPFGFGMSAMMSAVQALKKISCSRANGCTWTQGLYSQRLIWVSVLCQALETCSGTLTTDFFPFASSSGFFSKWIPNLGAWQMSILFLQGKIKWINNLLFVNNSRVVLCSRIIREYSRDKEIIILEE